MGFFSNVVHAVAAPVAAAVQAPVALVHGDIGGAVSAAVGGVTGAAAPVVEYSKAFFVDAPKNFVSGGAGAVKGVVAGDWKAAAQGVGRAFVAPTNIATAEGGMSNAFNDGNIISPTGYGAIAYGDTSSESYKRALATTAVIAGGAAAQGGFSGAGSAGGGLFNSGVTAEQAAQGIGAAGAIGAALAPKRGPSGIASATPAYVDGSTPLTQTEKVTLAVVGAGLLFLILRRF